MKIIVTVETKENHFENFHEFIKKVNESVKGYFKNSNIHFQLLYSEDGEKIYND